MEPRLGAELSRSAQVETREGEGGEFAKARARQLKVHSSAISVTFHFLGLGLGPRHYEAGTLLLLATFSGQKCATLSPCVHLRIRLLPFLALVSSLSRVIFVSLFFV